MPAALNLELDLNFQDFEYFTLIEIRKYVESVINRNKLGVERRIRQAVYSRLLRSNFYKQFTKGPMYKEIGNPNAERNLQSIFKIISDNLEVKFIPGVISTGFLNIEIQIGVLESSYKDILSAFSASYFSVNKKGTATLIEWMKWLLIGGGGPLVLNYEFASGPQFNKGSRTGNALMIKSDNGSWGLRTVWAGTYGDNVLTRELKGIELTFARILDLAIISKL
jgi:hypothetical protein